MKYEEIEHRRQQLIETVNKYGLNSTKVIKISKELDKFIAQYQRQQVFLSSLTPKKIS